MKQKSIQVKHLPDDEVLRAVGEYQAGRGDTADVALSGRYPVKVILAKMKQMVRRGVLQCGVSLRTAWVREQG
jgi:hypothetical protein